MLGTGLFLAALATASPVTMPSQRSGLPKVYRCPTVIERPGHVPSANADCRNWRRDVLARIAALPAAERVARVEALRLRADLPEGRGLDVRPDGTLYDAGGEALIATR